MTIEWGTAGAPLHGQTASGDLGVVALFRGGALVAVIDGLGHGTEACKAAKAAERVLVSEPTASISDLVRRCHSELRGTRGVVMSVASFDARQDTMSWLGVGNVEGLLMRAGQPKAMEAVAMRGGTIGYNLPPLNPRTLDVRCGDTLVLASDGIRHGFKVEVIAERTPQQIADEVARRWAKASDDACVVVARYAGAQEAA
jgi:hypothetical protein